MVAGEPSGDLLAGRLLSGLRPLLPEASVYGIGGANMHAHGFVSEWPIEKLTVRGLLAVIPRYREIKRIQTALRDRLLAERPELFIGVDYPYFNLGLEGELRQAGIQTMHFVSPQIWAWRGGRIKQIARAVSHMLVIFPFEEAIYRQAGIPVSYVGHPLAELIPMQPDVAAARAALGFSANTPVIAMLPGSRISELKYNSRTFIEAARALARRDRALRFVAPMAGAQQRRYFEQIVAQAGSDQVEFKIIDGQSHIAMAAADAALVASGTASLEVALHKKPMVIAYKMMRAEWEIMRHMGYQPWIGLPNILAREFVVPELLQDSATPQALADALWTQMQDGPGGQRLRERFAEMHRALLRNTACDSAQAVMNLITRSRAS